jgi:hypothetical protein
MHFMNHLKIAFLLLMVLFSLPVFASKKAKVVTESGKKWDVLFLKMSNDTIYLRARKPNGGLFSISGHKSKFQKIEFADGSLLDFSLSDFPPAEGSGKTGDPAGASAQHDTVFLATPSLQQDPKDSASRADQSTGEAWASSTSSFAPSLYQAAQDTATAALTASDTAVQSRGNEKRETKAPLDSGAAVSVETKPPNAVVRIDGNQIEGTTPLVARHLTTGQHTIVAYNDSLQASRIVSLGKGELKRLHLTLEKSKAEQSAGVKKKSRGLALSLSALSVVSFAGSAGTYYLYRKDHRKQMKTYEYLNNSSVKGPGVVDLIAQNESQHEETQLKLTISEILFGTGALLLGAGIIFYF